MLMINVLKCWGIASISAMFFFFSQHGDGRILVLFRIVYFFPVFAIDLLSSLNKDYLSFYSATMCS